MNEKPEGHGNEFTHSRKALYTAVATAVVAVLGVGAGVDFRVDVHDHTSDSELRACLKSEDKLAAEVARYEAFATEAITISTVRPLAVLYQLPLVANGAGADK